MDVDPVVPLAIDDLVRLAVARAVDLGARRRAVRIRDLRRGRAVAIALRRVWLGRGLRGCCGGPARGTGRARARAAARGARRGLVAFRRRARRLRARHGSGILVGAAAAGGLRRQGALLDLPRRGRRVAVSIRRVPGHSQRNGAGRGNALGAGLAVPVAVAVARESRTRERGDAQGEQAHARQGRNPLRHLVLSSFSNDAVKTSREERANNPYGYGFKRLFPWI